MRVCTGFASDLALAAVGLGLVVGDTGDEDFAMWDVEVLRKRIFSYFECKNKGGALKLHYNPRKPYFL